MAQVSSFGWTGELMAKDMGIDEKEFKSVGVGTSQCQQDLIYESLIARRGTEISLMWVPAHTGIPTNENIDKLAKKQLQRKI